MIIDEEVWKYYPPGTCYRLQVQLIQEPAGGYSIIATCLPRVVSQGETEREAIANIKEAFQVVVETYKDLNQPIPWRDPQFMENVVCKIKWLVIDLLE